MPRELAYIIPSVADLIGPATVGGPRKVRKKSRASGIPRLKLENGHYVVSSGQRKQTKGALRINPWQFAAALGGLAVLTLVFSAGARYEWQRASTATTHSKPSSGVNRPIPNSTRLVHGLIQKRRAPSIATKLVTPTPKASAAHMASAPIGMALPQSGALKAASSPKDPQAPQVAHPQHIVAPAKRTLPLFVKRPLVLASAPIAISIPPVPSILKAASSLERNNTKDWKSPENVIPQAPHERQEAHGVHVSLLQGEHQQPPINMAVPSGVNVTLLTPPEAPPRAASHPQKTPAAPGKLNWRVVTVMAHGVVVQRNGLPMQMVGIGDALPDGSTLSNVNPDAGQWESARPSPPQPTNSTKDVTHGTASDKPQ